MNIRRHIPNTITCCNLLCGCMAIASALFGLHLQAVLFILGGAVFDFFDGFAARLLKVSSPIGKELDSLADVVTFGVAPSALVFEGMLQTLRYVDGPIKYVSFAAFLMAAFSALRLAKFNLDERQTMGFIGLPTPANALFWSSYVLSMNVQYHGALGTSGWLYVCGTLALVVLFCFLLVSEVPMFAFKFKNYGWQGNQVRYLFLLFSIGVLAVLGFDGFTFIIIAYVLLSLVRGGK